MEFENPYKPVSATGLQVGSVGLSLEKIRGYRNCVRVCLVLYIVGLFGVAFNEPVNPLMRLCLGLVLLVSALFVFLLGRIVYGGFAALILLVLMSCLTPFCMVVVILKAGSLIRHEERRRRVWGDFNAGE